MTTESTADDGRRGQETSPPSLGPRSWGSLKIGHLEFTLMAILVRLLAASPSSEALDPEGPGREARCPPQKAVIIILIKILNLLRANPYGCTFGVPIGVYLLEGVSSPAARGQRKNPHRRSDGGRPWLCCDTMPRERCKWLPTQTQLSLSQLLAVGTTAMEPQRRTRWKTS